MHYLLVLLLWTGLGVSQRGVWFCRRNWQGSGDLFSFVTVSLHEDALTRPCHNPLDGTKWTFADDKVKRPDIQAPRFNITQHEVAEITPGYWFVAPYADLLTRTPSSLFSPGQIGPHIYDGHGVSALN